jgi:hypothetical protein
MNECVEDVPEQFVEYVDFKNQVFELVVEPQQQPGK